ncbi:hypothetical protein E2C01_042160 [Portunus trituberculatus]|uniref:Uncharacterized protein n=1 Tax=Portunus trituberculatus TaxID=210409 RepID=A0A5B7FSX7_PORTR|nr:hypothetical protein [Portunus trituberculatus]
MIRLPPARLVIVACDMVKGRLALTLVWAADEICWSRIALGRQAIRLRRAMTRFYIHSAYYLVVLYSFRTFCGGLK